MTTPLQSINARIAARRPRRPRQRRGVQLHRPQWAGLAEECAQFTGDDSRRVSAGRGAVPANDAEEHARCQRRRRGARQQRDRHVSGHVRQAGRADVEQTSGPGYSPAVRASAGRQGFAGHAARLRQARGAPGSAPQPRDSPCGPGGPPRWTSGAHRRRRMRPRRSTRPSSSAPCCRPFAAWRTSLGVNPLGLLAQAALETGWGKRMARTADGSPSLNMFGIKAGESWNGARAVADTVEFNGGVATQRRTAFRAYGSIEESVSDFANLLSNSPRYREAVAAGGNAQAYIHSIARSGYATDPEYGNKLNQILNSSTLRAALNGRVTQIIETPGSADTPRRWLNRLRENLSCQMRLESVFRRFRRFSRPSPLPAITSPTPARRDMTTNPSISSAAPPQSNGTLGSRSGGRGRGSFPRLQPGRNQSAQYVSEQLGIAQRHPELHQPDRQSVRHHGRRPDHGAADLLQRMVECGEQSDVHGRPPGPARRCAEPGLQFSNHLHAVERPER